jgi:hypothetical protein
VPRLTTEIDATKDDASSARTVALIGVVVGVVGLVVGALALVAARGRRAA